MGACDGLLIGWAAEMWELLPGEHTDSVIGQSHL